MIEPFPGKLPFEAGGAELSLVAQFAHIEQRAHHDGATAWNQTFTASSGAIAAARLPAEGFAEVLAANEGEWPVFCGTFPMSGTADPVPGGVRVSGRWGFASGIHDAAWVACGAVRTDGTGPIWVALPVREVVVHRTWTSPGLAATLSDDFTIDDVFVPEHRTFSTAGAPRRGGPIFHLPIQAYLTPDHTGVTLGCARRALDECVAQARGKRRLGSTTPLDQRSAFVRDLGRAHTRLAAVRAHVREVLGRLDATGTTDPTTFLDARAAATHAAEVAVDVATFAYRNGGAHAVHEASALGRAYRDAMTASQHVHVLDDVYEWAGAALLE